jgi:hypothetical protein
MNTEMNYQVKTITYNNQVFDVVLKQRDIASTFVATHSTVAVTTMASHKMERLTDLTIVMAGQPAAKKFVQHVLGLFDVVIEKPLVQRYNKRVIGYKFLNASADKAQNYYIEVWPVGGKAEADAAHMEFLVKYEQDEANEARIQQEARVLGLEIIADYSNLRIMQLEVEVEGHVFEVKRSLWNDGSEYIDVRKLICNCESNTMRAYNSKTTFPTNAERAAAREVVIAGCI